MTGPVASRRELLRWLLGSPAWLAAGELGWLSRALAQAPGPPAAIARAADALNVFDFEPAARRELLPAHHTYLQMGVDHEVTLAANREAFARLALRPRRLVDVREVDTRTSLLGQSLAWPVLLAPIGSQRAYHAQGELAVARAARRADATPIVSLGSSFPLGEVAEARGAPVWSQIYAQRTWPVTRHFIRRAEAAGCPVLVVTVDIVGLPTQRERILRYRRDDNPECQACHASLGGRVLDGLGGLARVVGIDPTRLVANAMIVDWDVLDRIRDATSMKLVVKGILTAEDAARCVEHGVDALVVSNHGGRAEDNGLASIDALREIAPAVAGRIPLLVDSGFRRGTDLYKALALGAAAVCVGRPYVWGLAAFGQQGVEAVLGLVRTELETAMRQMGTPSLAEITPERVRRVGAAARGVGVR